MIESGVRETGKLTGAPVNSANIVAAITRKVNPRLG